MILSIVIPVYNSENILDDLINQISLEIKKKQIYSKISRLFLLMIIV